MEKIGCVTAILVRIFYRLGIFTKIAPILVRSKSANICIETFGMKGRKEHLLLRAIPAQIRDKYVIGV